jgi:positive regulator of sigma E activity
MKPITQVFYVTFMPLVILLLGMFLRLEFYNTMLLIIAVLMQHIASDILMIRFMQEKKHGES